MMYGYGFGNHMLLFMIFIIILMIFIFKDSSSGKNKNSKYSETPIELLKIRYAKGEITEKEYHEIKQELY